MAKRLTTEDHLALLRQWRDHPASDQAIAQLKTLLESKRLHGLVVRRAAELALQWQARSLAEPLRDAALALSTPPDNAKRDPGCEGKTSVLKTLIEWESPLPDFFRAASHWTQIEPGMEKSTDSAAECRGLAAIGLAETGAPDGLMRLVDLFTDPQPVTRLNTAIALSLWRGSESIPLLRLKAKIGDESPDVLGEVLASLLRADPREQLRFVITFLDSPDPKIIEVAAIALGQSHTDAALQPLIAAFQRYQRHPIHTSLLMSIALLRTNASIDWCLEQLAKASPWLAGDLLDSLRIYRDDPRIVERIRAVATSPQQLLLFNEIFSGPAVRET